MKHGNMCFGGERTECSQPTTIYVLISIAMSFWMTGAAHVHHHWYGLSSFSHSPITPSLAQSLTIHPSIYPRTFLLYSVLLFEPDVCAWVATLAVMANMRVPAHALLPHQYQHIIGYSVFCVCFFSALSSMEFYTSSHTQRHIMQTKERARERERDDGWYIFLLLLKPKITTQRQPHTHTPDWWGNNFYLSKVNAPRMSRAPN